jgi:hypothetical protein
MSLQAELRCDIPVSGTTNQHGSRFVKRMPTVVRSCQQQGQDFLSLLVKAVTGQNRL